MFIKTEYIYNVQGNSHKSQLSSTQFGIFSRAEVNFKKLSVNRSKFKVEFPHGSRISDKFKLVFGICLNFQKLCVYISERKSTCLKKNLYNMEFVLNEPS